MEVSENWSTCGFLFSFMTCCDVSVVDTPEGYSFSRKLSTPPWTWYFLNSQQWTKFSNEACCTLRNGTLRNGITRVEISRMVTCTKLAGNIVICLGCDQLRHWFCTDLHSSVSSEGQSAMLHWRLQRSILHTVLLKENFNCLLSTTRFC